MYDLHLVTFWDIEISSAKRAEYFYAALGNKLFSLEMHGYSHTLQLATAIQRTPHLRFTSLRLPADV